MTVLDLIIQLQKMPQNLEVMFDATHPTAEMFVFRSVDEIEEIGLGEENTQIVCLKCGVEHPEINNN